MLTSESASYRCFKTFLVAGLERWRQIWKQRMSKPMSGYGDSFSLSYIVRTNADA
jgi:hypothetical protein